MTTARGSAVRMTTGRGDDGDDAGSPRRPGDDEYDRGDDGKLPRTGTTLARLGAGVTLLGRGHCSASSRLAPQEGMIRH